MNKQFFFKITFVMICFLFSLQQCCEAQQTSKNRQMRTEIFWIDLCKPTETGTITRTPGRGRFEMNWKTAYAFGLINTNHFKYDYKIGSVPYAFFVDTSYASFASTLKSAIDLTPDPIFKFVVDTKSPNKARYHNLDTTISKLAPEYFRLYDALTSDSAKYHIRANVHLPLTLASLPRSLQNDAKTVNEILEKNSKFLNISDRLYWAQESLGNLIPFTNQKTSLKTLLQELKDIGQVLQANGISTNQQISNLSSSIDFLPAGLYDISNTNPTQQSRTSEQALMNLSALLDVYQQFAQVIRNDFNQFEIIYNRIRNELIGNDCISNDSKRIGQINDLINSFFKAREAYYNLQSLYALNPSDNEYLESYLAVEAKYADFLFNKFNSLQKVININSIYVNPSYTNMKNYDIVTLEWEKTDKTSKTTVPNHFDIYLKGGMKVDFSAGLFGTFLTNYQYETVDSLDKDNNPTPYKAIRHINNGKVNIGFGGMVNITKRTGASWFAPGVSFGLVLSTQPSLQFTSGLTLSMGKTERLLLHAGYALGFVKRIDGLPLDVNIPTVRIGNQVRTIDKFLARPFFGLTYNLSKNNVFKVSSFTTSTGSGSSGSSDSAKDQK